MQRVQRFDEVVLAQHDDHPASDEDKLRMLDPELAAIGQVEHKRSESSAAEPQLDLFRIHRSCIARRLDAGKLESFGFE